MRGASARPVPGLVGTRRHSPMPPIVPALPHVPQPIARLDLAGAVVSALCALHCAAAPLLLAAASLALVPGPVATAIADERVEATLVGTAVLVAALSLRRARRRGHGGGWPTALLVGGLAAIVAGTLLEPRGASLATPLLVLGGTSVAGGHLRLRRRQRCAPVPLGPSAPRQAR